jgi:hypothetical protein
MKDLVDDTTSLRRDLNDLREQLAALTTAVSAARNQLDEMLAIERRRVSERASLAGIPHARLLTTSIEVEGRPTDRLRIRRLTVGEPVERSFSRSVGVTRCVTEAADVRELFNRLLAFEARAGDVLRGLPSTVLDVPGATVSLTDGRSLRISLGRTGRDVVPVVAAPRCTYDFSPKKRNNFGHWLLDCLPQIAVLAMIAPEARVLLHDGYKGFHAATLGLLGIGREQLVAWDGSPVECGRLLAFESDGRMGGGRPLSPLMEVRRQLAVPSSPPERGRLVYVSRRDAGSARQWVTNEAEVEGLFEARGFEIILMASCPLEEQVRLFREARIVAGVSGAGLSDLVFSAPDTHVIVLMSDSHMRWYAEEEGARSLWASGGRRGGTELAPFGDSPRFYAHQSAGFNQVCHSFLGPDDVPLDQLAGFLDEVLAVTRQ